MNAGKPRKPEAIKNALVRMAGQTVAASTPKKPKASEHAEQAAVIDWADMVARIRPELGLLFAIPNGAKLPYSRDDKGNRYSPQAYKLKAEGLRKGVPDLCLPVARKGYHGMFLELKVGNNKPSDEQEAFIEALRKQGYWVLVCWGADQAIREISNYLEI